MEKRVFDGVNNERSRIGVADLTWDDALANSARAQAANMMERGFFSHVDPVRGDLATRLDAAGIRWLRCGENLFTEMGYIEPVWTAMVEWMHSPGHKETLLDPVYTHSGVGIARNAEQRYFMAQIFTKPLPKEMERRLGGKKGAAAAYSEGWMKLPMNALRLSGLLHLVPRPSPWKL